MTNTLTQALKNKMEQYATKRRPAMLLAHTTLKDANNNPITILSIEEEGTAAHLGIPFIIAPIDGKIYIGTWGEGNHMAIRSIFLYGNVKNDINSLLEEDETTKNVIECVQYLPLVDILETGEKYYNEEIFPSFHDFVEGIEWETIVASYIEKEMNY